MTSLPIATAILTVIGFALIGLMIIASGQVFECFREIALNTRAVVSEHGGRKGGEYISLQILIQINHVIGVLVLVGAIGIVMLSLK